MSARPGGPPTPKSRRSLDVVGVSGVAMSMLFLTPTAHAAPDGSSLAIEPSSGRTNEGNIRLVTAQACPVEATSLIVQVSGATFPANSNVVGNTGLDGLTNPITGQGLVIPLFGSWDVVAKANGAEGDLQGDAQLRLLCLDDPNSRIVAQFINEVRFVSGGAGPSRYEQGGGPELASGLPLTVADIDQRPYVYRRTLPTGPGAGNGGGNTAPAPTDGESASAETESPDEGSLSTDSGARHIDTQPAPDETAGSVVIPREPGLPALPLLGLTAVAASALVGYVLRRRRGVPLWPS